MNGITLRTKDRTAEAEAAPEQRPPSLRAYTLKSQGHSRHVFFAGGGMIASLALSADICAYTPNKWASFCSTLVGRSDFSPTRVAISICKTFVKAVAHAVLEAYTPIHAARLQAGHRDLRHRHLSQGRLSRFRFL